ncbi:MAG: hypothetical protein QUS11_02820 [Candidatus Fermentibacter sp.]|nr:hypothetical protein [Candidatus Fermentibacter sp.]
MPFPAASTGFFADDYGMPPDPEGATVIDRELVWTYADSMDVILSILYSSDGVEYVDILSGEILDDGVEWNLLHTWPVSLDGGPVSLSGECVMEADEHDGSVYLTFVDDLHFYEGKVSIYLRFDLDKRGIEAGWSD